MVKTKITPKSRPNEKTTIRTKNYMFVQELNENLENNKFLYPFFFDGDGLKIDLDNTSQKQATCQAICDALVVRATKQGKHVEVEVVIHDKDKSKTGKGYVEPHVHVALHFKTTERLSTATKLLGEVGKNGKSQQVSAFKGKNGMVNLFCYLPHLTVAAMADHKHRYAFDEIAGGGTDGVTREQIIDFIKSKAGKMKEEVEAPDADRVQHLIYQISHGQVKMYQLNADPVLKGAMTLHSNAVDNAVKSYARSCLLASNTDDIKALKDLNAYPEPWENWYITGKPGMGKTLLARHLIAERFEQLSGKKCPGLFITKSAKNLFDLYNQEPAIIHDDARPSDLEPKEWLSLLDPYFATKVAGARYSDKGVVGLIYCLTCYAPFIDFFKFMPGLSKQSTEAVEQFYRRFSKVVKVTGNEKVGKNKLKINYELYQVEHIDGKKVKDAQYNNPITDINLIGAYSGLTVLPGYTKIDNDLKEVPSNYGLQLEGNFSKTVPLTGSLEQEQEQEQKNYEQLQFEMNKEAEKQKQTNENWWEVDPENPPF